MASATRSLASRLYRGEVSYDFLSRRRWWYLFSGLVILVSLVSLGVRGINPSIDFKGGAQFSFSANHHSLAEVRGAFKDAGITPEVTQTIGEGRVQVETQTLSTPQVAKLESAIVRDIGISRGNINVSTVGASWGGQITDKALTALAVFLIAVLLYLSLRFEFKMAMAAMLALLHDLVVTAGVYSLSGFQVSPDTVIALLTILGYSLYDTVVVFDKVRENTEGLIGSGRMTFSEAANLAINQTLMRSINTSIIALLPVIGLLGIGAGLLGAGSLDDLSLALLIGLTSGAYSSIFIATPFLADLKEREQGFQRLARQVASRRSREAEQREAPGGLATAAALAGGGTLPSAPAPAANPPAATGSPQRSSTARPARRRGSRGGARKRR